MKLAFLPLPPDERRLYIEQAALRRDYQAMRDMYLSEPAAFDEVLDVLTELEAILEVVSRLTPRRSGGADDFQDSLLLL